MKTPLTLCSLLQYVQASCKCSMYFHQGFVDSPERCVLCRYNGSTCRLLPCNLWRNVQICCTCSTWHPCEVGCFFHSHLHRHLLRWSSLSACVRSCCIYSTRHYSF
uniref:Secreted protein n=1 Tax=Cacopsylla melanoneura TaxID=428564 RepID=A0A8D8TRM0_9HEMI